jgi:hypothetical protein
VGFHFSVAVLLIWYADGYNLPAQAAVCCLERVKPQARKLPGTGCNEVVDNLWIRFPVGTLQRAMNKQWRGFWRDAFG